MGNSLTPFLVELRGAVVFRTSEDRLATRLLCNVSEVGKTLSQGVKPVRCVTLTYTLNLLFVRPWERNLPHPRGIQRREARFQYHVKSLVMQRLDHVDKLPLTG